MLKSASLFRKNGIVSVSIGHLKTLDELDEYMNLTSAFEEDFRFELDERDIRESTVEPYPETISELTDGFSACDSFVENVVKTAEAAGIKTASTMLVCYAFEFIPSKTKVNLNAPLRFLGSFLFSE